MNKSDCWIVIPAMNEARHVKEVVSGVRKQGFKNVVVVDDGSTDKTVENAKAATVLKHVVNLGKGAAMKTGAEYALKRKAKAIIFMDGDGQHNPTELPKFLKELDHADVVFGMRKARKNMPSERRLGSWIISTIIRNVFDITLKDPLCGYRAVTTRAYKKIRWDSRDYSVETEMIARTGKQMLKHREIEVETIYHSRYKGMSIPDGIKVMFQLVWWRMTH